MNYNIIPTKVELLDCQIDIILKSLELYAFNLHQVWGINKDSEETDLRNALLFHTYESLLSQKKGEYDVAYDLMKRCELKEKRKNSK